jgi:SAM-dependent methyltransferase
MSVLDVLLARSGAYEASRRLIGADNEMEQLVRKAVRPVRGERLLDFGCGNGRLARFVEQDVEYIGVDTNASYVADAHRKYGSPTTTFICGDVSDLSRLVVKPVDHVVSVGVLHHLCDDVAETALASALSILKPDGRLITMDPCFHPAQPSIARVLMALDRGRFVRHPADYQRLVERSGGRCRGELWTGVYRFPYTHWVQYVSRRHT